MDTTEHEPGASRELSAGRSKTGAINRRAALARLGLLAGAAYVAPTLAMLKGASANGSGGPPWQKKSKPSKSSKPSRPSR